LLPVVNQDALPADLEPVLAEGAKAMSRFSGKAGQLFEGFRRAWRRRAARGARRAGDAAGQGPARQPRTRRRRTCREYLASGETALTIDFAGAGLIGAGAAAVLLGARLRAWRHDAYRTNLPKSRSAA
jgi:leucyl aminopeptidase